jgi:addiction module RelE/StbE family toxin
MIVRKSLSFFLILTLVPPKKTDQIIETKVESLLEHPLMGVKRDIFRGRVLIIPEVSMIVSYWVDGETIRIMRVLHQKQNFPPDS